MKTITFKFTFIFVLCVLGLSLIAQTSRTQSYTLNSDNVRIRLTSNKKHIQTKDTLNVRIEITNLADKPILIFDEKYANAIYCSNCNIVTIDYGEYFDASIETEITMLIIKSSQNKVFNFNIPYSKLIEFYKKKYVNLEIGIGYIKNIQDIKRHEHPSLFKTKYFDNEVRVSSIIVELILRKLNVGSLKFTLE